jgi:hypothetical protein
MNPSGVGSDTGPLTWSISYYPFIGPGPQWGTPGYTFGEGQTTSPPKDTGANIGGVWQPSTSGGAGYGATLSWGLTCSSNTIQSIRQLLQRWKSAASYYPNIIISFDGGDSSSGSAYSPNSTPGSGNPDGTFGSVGAISNGVWVPTRKINSSFDAFCQGTGYARACSIENVT